MKVSTITPTITTIAPHTSIRTIVNVSLAHQLMDLLRDWYEVYELTGEGEFEINSIYFMLGLK